MFTTASLAARIERAEAGLIAEGAAAAARRVPPGQVIVRELRGGVAAFVEPGAPFNKVAGLGFAGVPSDDELERLEQEFRARAAPLQVEVSSLADPEIVRTLTARGYLLVGFENVLGLDPRQHGQGDMLPHGVEVRRAEPGEAAAWLDVVASAFMTPDVFDGPPSHEQIARDMLERIFGDMTAAPGFERFVAFRGDELAGGATFRVQDGIAQLAGAGTRPVHRRRGVQTALLRHRLGEAARRGCDVAVVTTQPGSKSQQNAQKAGFALLYARAILVKMG